MAELCSVMLLLDAIEAELKEQGLWSAQEPGMEALASQLPFCIDTLSFQQWL